MAGVSETAPLFFSWCVVFARGGKNTLHTPERRKDMISHTLYQRSLSVGEVCEVCPYMHIGEHTPGGQSLKE